jgi:hypothetical protein
MLFWGLSVSEAQTLSRDSLRNEFRYFIKLLEETHPDPYSEFGGKVEFHKQAFDIEQKIKSNDFTVNQYANMLSVFISKLHDGHSYISNNQKTEVEKYIPLILKPVSDDIIVSGVPNAEEKYLGSRIISINGIAVDSLCNRVAELTPTENKFGVYMKLKYLMLNPSLLIQVFPDLTEKTTVNIVIRTPENKSEEFTLNLTDEKFNIANFVRLPKQNQSLNNDEYLYYNFSDNSGNTMYLRMKSIMSKECFFSI